MNAIILAGGAGTRLREVVKDVPKPMAPVAGKPFLEFLILQLIKWKIKEIILSIGYKGDVIKSYFDNGKHWGIKIIYSEENEPLGTGGALREAVKFVNETPFIVMNGDSFFNLDYTKLLSFHKAHHGVATIGLAYVNDTSRYGKVQINQDGKIVGFTEKGINGHGAINGGVYVFNRKAAQGIPEGNVSLESNVLPELIKHGLYGMVVKGFFIDIGIPQDYLSLRNNFEQFKKGI